MVEDVMMRLNRAIGAKTNASTNSPVAKVKPEEKETQIAATVMIKKQAHQNVETRRVLVEIPVDLAVWAKVIAAQHEVNLSDVYREALQFYRTSRPD